MKSALATLLLLLASGVAAAQPAPGQTPTPTPTPAERPLTTLEKLWRALGLTATPRSQRGDLLARAGNIYVATLDENLTPVSRKKVATGAFTSPVFLPGGTHLLALKGETIFKVSVSLGPAPEAVGEVRDIVKLVQVSEANPDELVILTDADKDNCPTVAIYSLSSRQVTTLALERTADSVATRDYLIGSDRVYQNGSVRLFDKEEVSSDSPPVRWRNVYLEPKNRGQINVSGCPKGVNCVEPTFVNNNPALVAYIKVE